MIRNKFLLLFTAMSLTLVSLTGCAGGAKGIPAAEVSSEASNQNQTGSIKISNEWGETELDGTPKKVVTLDFSFIDTLVDLGVMPAGNAGVGETKIPEYLQDKITSDVTDVGERKAPNLEMIESVQPDLIIASQDRHNMIKKELQEIAPTVALDDNSYKEILDNVDTIAKAVGKQAEAAKIRADLESRISEAKAKIKNSPSVLVIGAFDDEYTVWLKSSFVGSLLSGIGANYVFDGVKGESEGMAEGAKMTLERLNEINPDFIFMYGDAVDKFKNNPIAQNMKSVKENHLIHVDRNLWSRGRGPIAADQILDEAIPLLTGQAIKK